MDLENSTPYPALLFRTVIDDRRIAAAVIARVTYDIVGGALVPSSEQHWKISPDPWECEYGPMEGDEVFRRGGADLFVFGHARAPKGSETTRLEVSVEVGSFRRRILVFGDRTWQKGGRGLVPSPPRPFRAIPLTLSHAFGGKDVWDSLEVPHSDNPAGKGFYLEEAHALGRPLPNIEDPDCLIEKWDARPEVAALVPCFPALGPRLKNGLKVDDQGTPLEVRPTLFNAAFPSMIVERLQPGDPVRISGVSETGPIAFSVPRSPVAVQLQFDDEVAERVPAVDQMGIECDRAGVFVTYRYPFRYVLHPLQRRSCRLRLPESNV